MKNTYSKLRAEKRALLHKFGAANGIIVVLTDKNDILERALSIRDIEISDLKIRLSCCDKLIKSKDERISNIYVAHTEIKEKSKKYKFISRVKTYIIAITAIATLIYVSQGV